MTMKKISWIIPMLVLCTNGVFALPPWTYTNTGINHTIIVDTSVHPTVDGVQLDAGDYIGVFYDSIGTLACGGYEMWTGTGAITVAAFGNDQTLPAKDGFLAGESFKWKIWRHGTGSVVNVQATYHSVSGIISDTSTYNTNGLSSLRSLVGLSQYLIISSSGPNGNISPLGIDTVTFGMNQTFIITPNTGYHIDTVVVDGLRVDSTTSYTFTNITTNHTIRAVFRINQYLIIASTGLHGTVSPSGTVQVNYGSSQEFIFNPDPGYGVDSLLVDSVKVTAVPNYTFVNVTRNHTLIVAFKNLQVSLDINIMSGWNLISNPLIDSNKSKSFLFPTGISSLFAYQGSYVKADSLENGIGYWLKFSSAQDVTIAGIPIITETVAVKQRWNMIGSISAPIAVATIRSIPPGIITSHFFGYSGSYFIADTIYPGKGYWVKSTQDGLLFLTSGPLTPEAKPIRIIPSEELPPNPPDGSDLKQETIPKSYALEQNYPNPFNPTATIKYDLPLQSRVSLKIYTLLGQVVATLKDGMEEAGYKSVQWNASNVASGVYFYRIESTSIANPSKTFTHVKKMVLMR